MALLAGFAYGYIYDSLVDLNDASLTAENIQGALPLFKVSILAWILIFVSDLLVTWAFYHFFKPIDRSLSAFTAVLRLIYTLILGLAIYNLIQVAIEPKASQLMDHLSAFESAWSLGLVIFGGHLFGLGLLSHKHQKMPRIWSLLLLIAGPAYTFTSIGHLTDWVPAEQLATIEMLLTLPMTLSEVGLAIWLLSRGRLI